LGPPANDCVVAIENYINTYAKWIYGLAFAIGTLLMLGVVGSFIMIYCIRAKSSVKTVTEYRYDILEENVI
jgi:hypothetical protein